MGECSVAVNIFSCLCLKRLIKMCTLFSFRYFSRLAVILERNSGKLAIVNSSLNLSVQNPARVSFENKLKLNNPNVTLCRYMAKGKDKGKKNQGKVIKIDEEELSRHFDLEKLNGDFVRVLDNFKRLLVEQASVRTSPASVEQLRVKYNGETYVIQDLAEVGKKSGKEIVLNMSAFIDAIPTVVEALRNSSLGLNPTQQGSSIIIPIPKVTREHRENLFKGAKSQFNKCKESIQSVQNKYIKKTDEFQGVSDDEIFRLKTQLTALSNKYIQQAQELLKVKEKELLSTD